MDKAGSVAQAEKQAVLANIAKCHVRDVFKASEEDAA